MFVGCPGFRAGACMSQHGYGVLYAEKLIELGHAGARSVLPFIKSIAWWHELAKLMDLPQAAR